MPDIDAVQFRRQLRLISILTATARAGFPTASSSTIQIIAYLADVLAPVWSFTPETSEVLKLTDGPFDPDVQRELDRLTARGLALASDLHYSASPGGHQRLRGNYRPNTPLTDPILDVLEEFEDEAAFYESVLEICLTMVGLSESEILASMLQDATYSDDSTSDGGVIYLSAREDENPTLRFAQAIGALGEGGSNAQPSEEVALYLLHLQRLAGRTAS